MLALRGLVRKRVVMFLLLALGAFAVGGSAFGAVAEAQQQQDAQAEDGDEGFNDWGLFGLLGLAGLAGLRRNRNEHDNRAAVRPDRDVDVRRSTTSGTGETRRRGSSDTDRDDDVDVRRTPSSR